jgi:hypothetical protein
MVLEDLAMQVCISGPERWIYIERVGRNYHKIVPDRHVVECHGNPRTPEI